MSLSFDSLCLFLYFLFKTPSHTFAIGNKIINAFLLFKSDVKAVRGFLTASYCITGRLVASEVFDIYLDCVLFLSLFSDDKMIICSEISPGKKAMIF